MSKVRLAVTLAVMAAIIFIGGSFATSAFPLQQSGAPRPGVATAAPRLAEELIYKPVTLRFAAGTTVRQALKFLGDTYGVTFIYEQGIGDLLDANIGPLEAPEVRFPTALTIVMGAGHLTARNVGERAIVIGRSPSAGGVGGAAGAARPGVATGTGAGVAGGTSTGVGGGVAGGVQGGVGGGVSGGVTTGAAARDVAPWRTSWPQDAVRVGGNIKAPVRITDVKPVYPKIAMQARVQGVVICEVLIGSDGRVADAHILRSIPLLDEAALDAVRQWEYTVPLLNGNPVPVIMTTTVNFTLDGGPPATGIPPRDTSALGVPVSSGVPVKYGQATDWPAAIRVGGNIGPPTKITDVRPVYPDVAQKARVQGLVICEVLIGPDGKVKDARVLRSIPLLDQAAFDAVLQWVFTPTLLNGDAVSVIMTVTVNFTLE